MECHLAHALSEEVASGRFTIQSFRFELVALMIQDRDRLAELQVKRAKSKTIELERTAAIKEIPAMKGKLGVFSPTERE